MGLEGLTAVVSGYRGPSLDRDVDPVEELESPGQGGGSNVSKRRKPARKDEKPPLKGRPTLAQLRSSSAAAGVSSAKETLRRLGKPKKRKKASPGILVAEGDSWFDYPFHDVLDELEDEYGYDVESVAHRGDTVEDMAFDEQQRSALARRLRKLADQNRTPKALLLSGGGNDIAGEQFSVLLNHERSGLPVLNEEVVSGLIDRRLDSSITAFVSSATVFCETFFDKKIPILLHGYAYPVPDGRGYWGGGWILPGPWLEPGFRRKGHGELGRNIAVTKVLIDRFNLVLSRIARRPGLRRYVRYVRLLDLLSNDPKTYKRWWDNELHPTERGFEKIAERFHETLTALG